MYNIGMSPNIVAFYPPINYPVSRQTQALHSIFPWDHTDVWILKSMTQEVSIYICFIHYLNNIVVIYL